MVNCLYKCLVFPYNEVAKEVEASLKNSKHFKCDFFSTSPEGPITTDVFDELNVSQVWELGREYDFIIPCHDELIYRLSRSMLPCSKIAFFASNFSETRNKEIMYKSLEGKVKVPKIYDKESAGYLASVPLFAKPRCGQGSIGAKKIEIGEPTIDYFNQGDLVTEFLPGAEFTVDCFSKKGKLVFNQPRVRVDVVNGVSETTEIIFSSSFSSLANTLSRELRMDGAWFFQTKKDRFGNHVLTDVGCRIAGASAITRLNGVNLTEMTLWHKLGFDVKAKPQLLAYTTTKEKELVVKITNLPGEDIVVDIDDTLLINTEDGLKVNVDLISALFKHKMNNPSKTFYLLTRREEAYKDLTWSLFLLTGYGGMLDWVNEVLVADKPITKSRRFLSNKPLGYGDYNNSLLIDDSFKERSEWHSVSIAPNEALYLL